jgi:hypothetical protein
MPKTTGQAGFSELRAGDAKRHFLTQCVFSEQPRASGVMRFAVLAGRVGWFWPRSPGGRGVGEKVTALAAEGRRWCFGAVGVARLQIGTDARWRDGDESTAPSAPPPLSKPLPLQGGEASKRRLAGKGLWGIDISGRSSVLRFYSPSPLRGEGLGRGWRHLLPKAGDVVLALWVSLDCRSARMRGGAMATKARRLRRRPLSPNLSPSRGERLQSVALLASSLSLPEGFRAPPTAEASKRAAVSCRSEAPASSPSPLRGEGLGRGWRHLLPKAGAGGLALWKSLDCRSARMRGGAMATKARRLRCRPLSPNLSPSRGERLQSVALPGRGFGASTFPEGRVFCAFIAPLP